MYFYEWESTYPALQKIDYNIVRAELSKDGWQDWPEYEIYKHTDRADWKVIPLCATFPGNDPTATKWDMQSVERFPRTVAFLKQIPGLRTAGFSRLGPHTSLDYHRGWAKLSNHVLRCHLPLVVPEGDILCGVIVNQQVQFHREGEWIVFDDSEWHKAFNYHSSKDRIVLLLDIARPSHIPLGTSPIEMTDALTTFLSAFT